jgi:hypothetical protein
MNNVHKHNNCMNVKGWNRGFVNAVMNVIFEVRVYENTGPRMFLRNAGIHLLDFTSDSGRQ